MSNEVETVPWHLSGNWEPMQVEATTTDLETEGQIGRASCRERV